MQKASRMITSVIAKKKTFQKKVVKKPKKTQFKGSIFDEIRAGNFKLKKVDRTKPKKKPQGKQMSKQEELSLTSTLANAIKNRNNRLNPDQDLSESSQDDDSGWTEDSD